MNKMRVLGCLFALAFMASCTTNQPTQQKSESIQQERREMKFTNEQFYDVEGIFLPERAKDALIEMLEYHNYPIFESLRERIWVTDYNKGNYAELGLASITFINDTKDRYMLMDIFLLPGQMLGEHMHFAAEGNPAKMEGWLVRYGKSYIVGIGEDNMSQFPEVVVPSMHWDGKVTARNVVEANVGDFVQLAEVESPHWQLAGPEGAIITEVANVHTGSGVRRSDPAMN